MRYMISSTFVSVLLVIGSLPSGFLYPQSISKLDPHTEWESYKQKFEISVPQTEEERRKEIFMKNYLFIQDFNTKNHEMRLEINKFAHFEKHEVPKGLKIDKPIQVFEQTVDQSSIPTPKSKDWRQSGMVSSVKDQGRCGSCYSFSAIGAIESSFAIKTGKLVNLSEQQIVDCSSRYGTNGCNGGWMNDVFEYAMDNGIVNNKLYNYTGTEDICRIPQPSHHGRRLISYVNIRQGDERRLVIVLAYVGPVSIAIDADHEEFRFYKSGIIRIPNCSATNVDHAVLAVGYMLGNDPYLIVKNSWGTDWGMSGYFKLALFDGNMCGLASYASYPIPFIDREN